ncbi:MAG: hypothetical protein WCK42_00580 [Myxococcaceae bacterium]
MLAPWLFRNLQPIPPGQPAAQTELPSPPIIEEQQAAWFAEIEAEERAWLERNGNPPDRHNIALVESAARSLLEQLFRRGPPGGGVY